MPKSEFAHRRIVVIGDLMVDKYVAGSVARLSPEAPVPVLLRQEERAGLGGAANVAATVASLGAEVRIFGVIGQDEPGELLLDLFRSYPLVTTAGIEVDAARPTTCKTRVMCGSHQIVRIDTEVSVALPKAIEDRLIASIEDVTDWADVVVVSDYAKGLCSNRIIQATIDCAAAMRKPSIIDPKRRDLAVYRGATLIKPNTRELIEATGMPCETDIEVEGAAAAAIDITASAILVTRSERGMSYVERGKPPVHAKTAAREVFDVSGAGDTVLALLALGYAARLPIVESMRFANVAASIAVGRVGTAVVTAQELDVAMEETSGIKIRRREICSSLAEAEQLRDAWRKRGLNVGLTNGCYDVLHPGHVALLEAAALACDRLIVAINSDASVRRLKGPSRPVQAAEARAAVLVAMRAVDAVVIFDEDTPASLIATLRPDLLVKGSDYTLDQVVGADVVRASGGRVMLVPLADGHSTTSIIRRISGDP